MLGEQFHNTRRLKSSVPTNHLGIWHQWPLTKVHPYFKDTPSLIQCCTPILLGSETNGVLLILLSDLKDFGLFLLLGQPTQFQQGKLEKGHQSLLSEVFGLAVDKYNAVSLQVDATVMIRIKMLLVFWGFMENNGCGCFEVCLALNSIRNSTRHCSRLTSLCQRHNLFTHFNEATSPNTEGSTKT